MHALNSEPMVRSEPGSAVEAVPWPPEAPQQALWFVELTPAEGISFASPAFEQIWGRPLAELCAGPDVWLEDIHADDLPRVRNAHARWLAHPYSSVYDVEFRLARGDGSWRWIRDTGHVISAGALAQRRFAHVAEDITARKLEAQELREINVVLERRLHERSAELERTVREVEAFSYSISHDLRAPLRALDGFSHALAQDCATELSETGQRYLAIIRASAQKMGQLIDGLLAFSRLGRQPLHRQTSDTEPIVRSALDRLAPLQEGRRIDLRIEALPPSQGDLALLQQVWIQLLSNALKYTRGRPTALIEVGSVFSGSGAGPVAEFYVRDNGVGFDKRYVHKLFGMFQRLHRAEDYEGTGVGLALVQRIVQRHGGQVRAEGDTGKGAAFYFSLGEP